VQPGEFVSLIGPSGCGKSTILSIVAGFMKPTAGDAKVDDKPITKPGSDRGVVFQQYSLFPWLSVRKNVEFGLKMAGVPQGKRNITARELLDLAGLLSFENHYPDQLSGGMKQRIGIVRALATSPQVLLMDEPFGALDAQTRESLQSELLQIHARTQKTIVFVTHDLDEAVLLADRVVVMQHGRLQEIVTVPLPRPRGDLAKIRGDVEFAQTRFQIWRALRAGAPIVH
jgi:NitT/TauT family transport system ATP-binding protein